MISGNFRHDRRLHDPIQLPHNPITAPRNRAEVSEVPRLLLSHRHYNQSKNLPSHLETAALIPKVDVNTVVLSHEPTDLPTRAFASSYK